MNVNFTLPDTVPAGTQFPVTVAVRHATIGTTVTVDLAEVIGAPPAWPGDTQSAIATAASPSAADASLTFVFYVTLGGPGRAHLKATARDTASGYDVHAEHTEVQ